MKEYEYMLMAIEEYLCHYNTIAICSENYTGINFPNAHEELFDKFIEILEIYKNQFENKDENEYIARCNFRRMREDDLKSFMKDVSKIDSVNQKCINLEDIVKGFLANADKIKNCALEDRVLLYPYIISEIRNREEE